MTLESQIVDALYKKLGGIGLPHDLHLPNGELLPMGPMKKRRIQQAVALGGLPVLMDLLIVDPSRLGRTGTKKIRDGLERLSSDSKLVGEGLALELSHLLRKAEK